MISVGNFLFEIRRSEPEIWIQCYLYPTFAHKDYLFMMDQQQLETIVKTTAVAFVFGILSFMKYYYL